MTSARPRADGFVHQWRLALVALQFLTRVPVRLPGVQPHGPLSFDERWLNDCTRYFGVVGLAVGAFGAVVLLAAGLVWPQQPVLGAAVVVVASVWLTGAFHEDGLADTFDALGGAVSRERALAIMKDSRIGTYGGCALVASLGLRTLALAACAGHGYAVGALAWVFAHGAGRCAAVAMMALLPYGGDAEHARAKPLATRVRPALAWQCTAMSAAAFTMISIAAYALYSGGTRLFSLQHLSALAAGVAVTVGLVWQLRRWLARRLGGYTGDTLGATEQITEMAVLLAAAAVLAA
jgi:adenosylcobinamide-GDP ribazoletransferase